MYEGVYKRGIAVGQSNILTDTMTFRFKDELFEFPIIEVIHIAHHNGYYYEAKVKRLRALRAKGRNKNGIRRAI